MDKKYIILTNYDLGSLPPALDIMIYFNSIEEADKYIVDNIFPKLKAKGQRMAAYEKEIIDGVVTRGSYEIHELKANNV